MKTTSSAMLLKVKPNHSGLKAGFATSKNKEGGDINS